MATSDDPDALLGVEEEDKVEAEGPAFACRISWTIEISFFILRKKNNKNQPTFAKTFDFIDGLREASVKFACARL